MTLVGARDRARRHLLPVAHRHPRAGADRAPAAGARRGLARGHAGQLDRARRRERVQPRRPRSCSATARSSPATCCASGCQFEVDPTNVGRALLHGSSSTTRTRLLARIAAHAHGAAVDGPRPAHGLRFVLILVITRAVGRRELSSMEPFDLILLVVIGDLVQQGVTQSDYSLTGATTVLVTMAVLVVATAWLSFRFARLRPLLEGEPTLLISDGEILDAQPAPRAHDGRRDPRRGAPAVDRLAARTSATPCSRPTARSASSPRASDALGEAAQSLQRPAVARMHERVGERVQDEPAREVARTFEHHDARA